MKPDDLKKPDVNAGKTKQKGTSTYNEDNCLPDLFIKDVEPISSRLSKGDLLNRCLKGMTENQNDAANGMFWPRSTQTRFCGARRVRIAECETVTLFNIGEASKAFIMELRCLSY